LLGVFHSAMLFCCEVYGDGSNVYGGEPSAEELEITI
jgi:hypothetical protein